MSSCLDDTKFLPKITTKAFLMRGFDVFKFFFCLGNQGLYLLFGGLCHNFCIPPFDSFAHHYVMVLLGPGKLANFME